MPGQELTITGLYGIRLNPYGVNKLFMDAQQTSIFNRLHLSLRGFYTDEGLTFKMNDRGEAAACSSLTGKRLCISAKSGIAFWAGGEPDSTGLDTPDLSLTPGKLTIGNVAQPQYALNICGGIYTERFGVKTFHGRTANNTRARIGTLSNHALELAADSRCHILLNPADGNTYIGFGSTLPQVRTGLLTRFSLYVNKGVLAEDFSIGPKSSWADFVFDTDYQPMPLQDLERYIISHKRLPDVPSEADVAADGYSQHEFNKALLKRIEELTLHIIRQQKEIDSLRQVVRP